jgi:hypothetical protein
MFKLNSLKGRNMGLPSMHTTPGSISSSPNQKEKNKF